MSLGSVDLSSSPLLRAAARLVGALALLAVLNLSAAPAYIEVTASNVPARLAVRTAELAPQLWGFSLDVQSAPSGTPGPPAARLLVQDGGRATLLSATLQGSALDAHTTRFHAAVAERFLDTAVVQVQDKETVFVVRLRSFRDAHPHAP